MKQVVMILTIKEIMAIGKGKNPYALAKKLGNERYNLVEAEKEIRQMHTQEPKISG